MTNLKELQKKYEELRAEIERLQNEKDSGIWEPEEGDDYYYVDGYGVVCLSVWNNDSIDENHLSIGNIFRTIEEAERHVEKLKLIKELKVFAQGFKPDWRNPQQEKFNLFYSYRTNQWDWGFGVRVMPNFTLPYFASKERAKEAIKHFGERLNVLLD